MNPMLVLCAVLLVTAGWSGLPKAGLHRLQRPRPRRGGLWGVLQRWDVPGAMGLRRRLVLGGALGVSLGLAAGGWWFVVVIPTAVLAVVLVLGRIEPASAQRTRERRVIELPQVLDLLSCGLSAGQPLRTVTSVVADTLHGPLADDLNRVLSCLGVGMSEAEAWSQLAHIPEWRVVARDVTRAASTGASLAEVLGQHAEQARRLRRGLLQRRTKTLGIRSVFPMVTCFLPAFVLVGIVPVVGSMIASFFVGLS